MCALKPIRYIALLGVVFPLWGCDQADTTASPATASASLDSIDSSEPIETGVWQMKGNPTQRRWHALAYDSARGKLVLFGGQDNENASLDDIWEWDGSTWTQPLPSTSPPARHFHALAYDADRNVTVLFGGTAGTGAFDDTWEWDGTSWTQRTVAGPPARSGHALAYDSHRKVVVLFGGRGESGANLDDTWEWDGSSWTQITTVSRQPEARYRHALAYDSQRRRVVLFGGTQNDLGSLDDTWEWDGFVWAQIATPSPPPLNTVTRWPMTAPTTARWSSFPEEGRTARM